MHAYTLHSADTEDRERRTCRPGPREEAPRNACRYGVCVALQVIDLGAKLGLVWSRRRATSAWQLACEKREDLLKAEEHKLLERMQVDKQIILLESIKQMLPAHLYRIHPCRNMVRGPCFRWWDALSTYFPEYDPLAAVGGLVSSSHGSLIHIHAQPRYKSHLQEASVVVGCRTTVDPLVCVRDVAVLFVSLQTRISARQPPADARHSAPRNLCLKGTAHETVPTAAVSVCKRVLMVSVRESLRGLLAHLTSFSGFCGAAAFAAWL